MDRDKSAKPDSLKAVRPVVSRVGVPTSLAMGSLLKSQPHSVAAEVVQIGELGNESGYSCGKWEGAGVRNVGDVHPLPMVVMGAESGENVGGLISGGGKYNSPALVAVGEEAMCGGQAGLLGPVAGGYVEGEGRSFLEAVVRGKGSIGGDEAKGLKNARLKRVDVQMNSRGRVILPGSLAEKGSLRWKNTLIGVVLGRRIPLSVIDKNVRRMWNKWGVSEVCYAGAGLIFIRFPDDRGFEEILQRGDWTIVGCPFLVRRWATGLTYDSLEPASLPLWIKLKNVPLEYCYGDGVEYIVSSCGTPLKIDLSLMSRDVIRVLVEFEAAVPLKHVLQFSNEEDKDIDITIDYEFMPLQCSKCIVFGHDELRCPKKKADRATEGTTQREEMKWKVVDRKSGSKGDEMAKNILKRDVRTVLVSATNIEVGEPTPQEKSARQSAADIPIGNNQFQILEEEVDAAEHAAIVERSGPPIHVQHPGKQMNFMFYGRRDISMGRTTKKHAKNGICTPLERDIAPPTAAVTGALKKMHAQHTQEVAGPICTPMTGDTSLPVQDRLLELQGCCEMDLVASMEERPGDKYMAPIALNPLEFLPSVENVGAIEHKVDFMEVSTGETNTGNSIVPGPSSTAEVMPDYACEEVEYEIAAEYSHSMQSDLKDGADLSISPPMTRSRVKDGAFWGGTSSKKGWKPRRASK